MLARSDQEEKQMRARRGSENWKGSDAEMVSDIYPGAASEVSTDEIGEKVEKWEEDVEMLN